MADQEKAGGGPITRTLKDGRVVEFAELSFRDRTQLMRAHRATVRKARVENYQLHEIPKDRQCAELLAFDTVEVGYKYWNAVFFDSNEGKDAILVASLKKQGENNVQDVMDKLTGSDLEIARLCAVITDTALQEDSDKPKGAPDPKAPPKKNPGDLPPPVPAEQKAFGKL